jgi:hypothetical protein
LNHLSLSLSVSSKLKMLASLQRYLLFHLTFLTLHTENYFLRGFSLYTKLVVLHYNAIWVKLYLFVKYGLRLTPISFLFAIVSPFSLSIQARLPGFVLSDFMQSVLSALSLTKSPSRFRYIHLENT